MIRRTQLKQDAVVAAAILVLLLAIWRLVLHPQRAGPLGQSIQAALVGANGSRLLGGGNGNDASPTSPAGAPEGGPSTVVTSNAPAGGTGTNALASAVSNTPAAEPSVAIPDVADDTPSTNSPDAPAMTGRLHEANAKTGDIQLTLLWNNTDDLDLHCVDPRNFEIFYSATNSPLTGGTLDVDRNASPPFTSAPIENIYWPVGQAPGGIYSVYVVYYALHGGRSPTPFTVRTVVQQRTNYFPESIAFTGRHERKWICTFRYDPAAADPTNRMRFLPQPPPPR